MVWYTASMLIDDVEITVTAGHGGKGAVAFQKNILSLGPTGGRGGNGGSVIAVATSDIGALAQFRHTKSIKADDGAMGRIQLNDGTAGEHRLVRVPVGTVFHNLDLGTTEELTHVGQELLLAKGGFGGKGNFGFRSSTNTTPVESQPGLPGKSYRFRLELKLIVDVGLIGLPNAGKSSLLNELTNAKSKVGNYPFTTLEPHLGVYYDLILADIPGLIEGASEGKGLGDKFLRHIERTRVIFHLVSADTDDVARDYKEIRTELSAYSNKLSEKEISVFLTKSDLTDIPGLEEKLEVLRAVGVGALPISIYDDQTLEPLKRILDGIARAKNVGTSKSAP